MIKFLCWLKLNSIAWKRQYHSVETLVSQALIDMEIGYEECITNLKEKYIYGEMKENVRNVSEKLEEKKTRKHKIK